MILVTGSSGNVGSAVVACLRVRGIMLRVGARDPAGLAAAEGTEIVRCDFRDPGSFHDAVAGCDGLFLLRPPAIADTRRTLLPFLDVARAEGVRQVVFLSVAGAAHNPVVPHHAVERHLMRGPDGWTILRPGFFAQNLGDAYRRDIARDDRLFVPAGTGRVAFVDVRDVAEVAIDALIDRASHRHQAYTLTGPEALSFIDAAGILSRALSRPIAYHPASVAAYVRHLHRRGLPLPQVVVQTLLHVGLRFGQAETVDATLQQLLGRQPRTLDAYVRDHLGLWT